MVHTRNSVGERSTPSGSVAAQLVDIAAKFDAIVSQLRGDVATLKTLMFGTSIGSNNHTESDSGRSLNESSNVELVLSTTQTIVNSTPCSHVVPKPTSNQAPTITPKLDRLLDHSVPPFSGSVKQQTNQRSAFTTPTYSSIEEAIETRKAVGNLKWRVKGGRLLMTDFVDPQEVKNCADQPPPYWVVTVTTRCNSNPTHQSVMAQCWVFDTGQQGFTRTALSRLEDKSYLRPGCIDTNPDLGQGRAGPVITGWGETKWRESEGRESF